MAKPIVTFSMSDDGSSVFVYTDDILNDEGALEAILDIQREDFEFQIQEYALHGVREAILSRQAH